MLSCEARGARCCCFGRFPGDLCLPSTHGATAAAKHIWGGACWWPFLRDSSAMAARGAACRRRLKPAAQLQQGRPQTECGRSLCFLGRSAAMGLAAERWRALRPGSRGDGDGRSPCCLGGSPPMDARSSATELWAAGGREEEQLVFRWPLRFRCEVWAMGACDALPGRRAESGGSGGHAAAGAKRSKDHGRSPRCLVDPWGRAPAVGRRISWPRGEE